MRIASMNSREENESIASADQASMSPFVAYISLEQNRQEIDKTIEGKITTDADGKLLCSKEDEMQWLSFLGRWCQMFPSSYERVRPLLNTIKIILDNFLIQLQTTGSSTIDLPWEKTLDILVNYVWYYAVQDLFDAEGNILPAVFNELNDKHRNILTMFATIDDEKKLKSALLNGYLLLVFQDKDVGEMINKISHESYPSQKHEILQDALGFLFLKKLNKYCAPKVIDKNTIDNINDTIASYRKKPNEISNIIENEINFSNFINHYMQYQPQIDMNEIINATNPAIRNLFDNNLIIDLMIDSSEDKLDRKKKFFLESILNDQMHIGFFNFSQVVNEEIKEQERMIKKSQEVLPLKDKKIETGKLNDETIESIKIKSVDRLFYDAFYQYGRDISIEAFQREYEKFILSWDDELINLLPNILSNKVPGKKLSNNQIVKLEDMEYLVNITKNDQGNIYVDIIWDQIHYANKLIPGFVTARFELTAKNRFKLVEFEPSNSLLKKLILTDRRQQPAVLLTKEIAELPQAVMKIAEKETSDYRAKQGTFALDMETAMQLQIKQLQKARKEASDDISTLEKVIILPIKEKLKNSYNSKVALKSSIEQELVLYGHQIEIEKYKIETIDEKLKIITNMNNQNKIREVSGKKFRIDCLVAFKQQQTEKKAQQTRQKILSTESNLQQVTMFKSNEDEIGYRVVKGKLRQFPIKPRTTSRK